MQRAILVALGIGTIISSAAAIGVATTVSPVPAASNRGLYEMTRTRDAARNTQRLAVESRYQGERAKCAGLAGAAKDACLIAAHAVRGRLLLEIAAPYEMPASG